jgi:hypothetical protein
VAATTTSQQTQTSAEHKTQLKAQRVGCGCAKELFPTTTKEKQAETNFNKKAKLTRNEKMF